MVVLFLYKNMEYQNFFAWIIQKSAFLMRAVLRKNLTVTTPL